MSLFTAAALVRGALQTVLNRYWGYAGIAIAFAVFHPITAESQIAANAKWSVLSTPHFRIYFTPELDSLARVAAQDAERAYANLASELVSPRGTIDLVLTDAVDGSNGSASVFPRNCIIVYARPPIDVNSLESYDNWLMLVIQHELAHIFHLDRTRGIWHAGQWVFGRHPALFPNAYVPSWLKEGVAVYYESRFTPGGRLDGGYQYAIARTAARHRLLPPLDALSLARSEYPGGSAAYIYGSFLVDNLAQRHGTASMRKMVEQGAGQLVPVFLDHTATKSFGESFSTAWQRWRDSVSINTPQASWPNETWRPLTAPYRAMWAPRWQNDSTILFTADDGVQSPALYRVTTGGTVQRIARRSSLDATAPGPDGTLVFAQLDYVDRFRVQSDLYITKDGRTRRLTVGQRLSAPDVRADGEIIAVQTTPGSTRLVRVSRDGKQVYPLIQSDAAEHWSNPRWAPDGSWIVAQRHAQGQNDIVIISSRGTNAHTVGGIGFKEVIRSVAWSPDGRGVYISLEQEGESRVYYSPRNEGEFTLVQTPEASLGIFGLDAHQGIRSGRPQLASIYMQGDGYGIAFWSPENVDGHPAQAVTAIRDSSKQMKVNPGDTLSVRYDRTAVRGYSPWRSLFPSYWSPILDASGNNGTLVGALTSGNDVIGRHAYTLQGWINLRDRRKTGLATYRYSRLRSAIVDIGAEQGWSYTPVFNGTAYAGNVDERIQQFSMRITVPRVRTRTYSAIIFGVEHETHDYAVTPDTLLPRLVEFYHTSHRYPALVGAVQFSNVQRPTLSVSPEDGIALSATARQRWASEASTSKSLSGVASVYKSLDAVGFAHHVIALRVAGAMTDAYTPTRFSVGGISGVSLALFPGFSVGDQARMFPIRGFGPSVQQGTRAYSGSLEYRAPFVSIGRGLGLWPIFVDRTSLTFFGDAGRAYCHASSVEVCTPQNFGTVALVSAGMELNLDAALQYDVAYRFRIGVAAPVRGGSSVGQTGARAYITVGSFF